MIKNHHMLDGIMCVLDWVEAYPALMQALAIIVGAIIALIAACIAYKGVKEQIGATLLLDSRSENREKKYIYLAFAADLDALKKALAGIHSALDGETGENEILKSVFLAARNVVWESCAPKIGMLDKNNAANIIETYRFIDGLTSRARVLNLKEPSHRADLAALIDATIKQIDVVLKGLPSRPDRENVPPK